MTMHVGVVTLFPEIFEPVLRVGMTGRALTTGALRIVTENLRDHGQGVHRAVDDTPYGGGSGMVLRVDIVVAAIEALEEKLGQGRTHRVLMTPQGKPFSQSVATELAARPTCTLICGRYEGFDERVRSFVDEEISLGDYVLAGGEIPALAIVDACARLLPGVLGNPASLDEESHAHGAPRLEYPQFTRPQEFRGLTVPEVLSSGHHVRISDWRRQQATERTAHRRPDLAERSKSDRGA